MSGKLIRLGLAVFSVLAALHAQDSSKIHTYVVKAPEPVTDRRSMDVALEQAVRILDQRQPEETTKGYVRDELTRDSWFLKHYFRVPVEAMGRAMIVSDVNNNDVLIGRWPLSSGSVAKDVIVWDGPDFNVFLFEVEPELLKEPGSVQDVLAKLLIIPGVHEITGVYYDLYQDKNGPGIVGRGHVDPAPFASKRAKTLVYGFGVLGMRTTSKAYIAFGMGKQYAPYNFYPLGTVGLPERFPPLSSRIKRWSTAEIIRSLGRGMTRDRVLMDELASRELSDDEFNQIMGIADTSDKGVRSSLTQQQIDQALLFVDAIFLDARKGPIYEGKLQRAIVRYGGMGATGEQLLKSLLPPLALKSEVDLSESVLKVMKGGHLVAEGIEFFRMGGGHTQKAYDELSALDVPKSQEQSKKAALDQMRVHIR